MQPEFQVVVLAGGIGQRLAPLTPDIPKAMLPVVNRPMLAYTLDTLRDAGFAEAIIVTSEIAFPSVVNYVRKSSSLRYRGRGTANADSEPSTPMGPSSGVSSPALTPKGSPYGDRPLLVDIAVCKDPEGSLDALRAVKDLIESESFIVVSSDLFVDATIHPIHFAADIHRVQNSACTMILAECDSGKIEKGLMDYVAIDSHTHCVVGMHAAADIDRSLDLSKTMLLRHPRTGVRKDLADLHFYFFSKWVLELVERKKEMLSIKDDLIPFLIRLQPFGRDVVARHVGRRLGEEDLDDDDALVVVVSAYVEKERNRSFRVNTIPLYMEVNQRIARGNFEPRTRGDFSVHPTVHATGANVGKGCFVGEHTVLGDKAVVKHSIIGRQCTVGAGVKIVDCVVMDHVVIRDSTTLEGCIIGNFATIQQRCRLIKSHVAARYNVPEETIAKEEIFADNNLSLESANASGDDAKD